MAECRVLRVPGVLRRLWVVYCDHSIVGIWRTRREADAAVRLRREQAQKPIDHHVEGPYVLQQRAS